MLNGKVTSYLRDLIESGVLSAQDAAAIAQASSTGLDSLSSINSLPDNIQTAVRDAFRQGSRYAFISLIPWAGLALLTSLFLSKIPDSDREPQVAELTYEMSEPKDDEAATPNLNKEAKPFDERV